MINELFEVYKNVKSYTEGYSYPFLTNEYFEGIKDKQRTEISILKDLINSFESDLEEVLKGFYENLDKYICSKTNVVSNITNEDSKNFRCEGSYKDLTQYDLSQILFEDIYLRTLSALQKPYKDARIREIEYQDYNRLLREEDMREFED